MCKIIKRLLVFSKKFFARFYKNFLTLLTIYLFYDESQKKLYKLKNKDYSHLILDHETEHAASEVATEAKKIYGSQNFNRQSNAVLKEVLYSFQIAINYLKKSNNYLRYLEIGSCQGLSMSLIVSIAKQKEMEIVKAVSIDPYFEEGYFQGSEGIWKKDIHLHINKTSKHNALNLYSKLNLNVELIEKYSDEGLLDLIKNGSKFNLIYVDGFHENLNPLIDICLSLQLLDGDGLLMIDDHHWPDIEPIKNLLDRNLTKIHECWKVVIYKINNIHKEQLG